MKVRVRVGNNNGYYKQRLKTKRARIGNKED